jgi:2-haloacid dehalogenase
VPYRTLLIDLDHTIFDFDASELAAFDAALALLGVDRGTTAEHLATYQRLNTALWAAAERGEIRSSEIRNVRFHRLADELGVVADDDTVTAVADAFVAGLGHHGDLFPGALDVLEQLATRVDMAIVSNGLGEVVHARLARLGIEHLFRGVIVSSEVGASKPSPRIFDAAFEQLGNPPKATVLMVGDSLTSDIAGGRAYGIDTCWYNPDGRLAPEPGTFTYAITDLAELLTLV